MSGFTSRYRPRCADRLFLEMLGQFGDLDIGQTAVGLSNGRQLAGRLVAHREGVIAQDVIALAVAELCRHHHDVERRQFLL